VKRLSLLLLVALPLPLFAENALDNFEKARAEAAKRKLPLVVEVWKPWSYSDRLLRALLADPTLGRYAKRFVWVELDFDKPANQPFLTRHGVTLTPAVFVLDPADERATAARLGGMTLSELTRFLDRGERPFAAKRTAPGAAGTVAPAPDEALAIATHGDELLGAGKPADAAAAYRQALTLGGKNWSRHDRAIGALTWSLMASQQSQACAETAAAEAPHMTPDEPLARVVVAGLACVKGESAPWAESAKKILEPLAGEAIALPTTLRDYRFQLYQDLIDTAAHREDKESVSRWADQWLDEVAATPPRNEDERAAFDIMRVEAASILDDPARILPTLRISERAMSNDYTASLRLAQMETMNRGYKEAITACDHGLRHVSGPIGRSYLLETKAAALIGSGDRAGARKVLEDALQVAQTIPQKATRDQNVEKITKTMKDVAP